MTQLHGASEDCLGKEAERSLLYPRPAPHPASDHMLYITNLYLRGAHFPSIWSAKNPVFMRSKPRRCELFF